MEPVKEFSGILYFSVFEIVPVLVYLFKQKHVKISTFSRYFIIKGVEDKWISRSTAEKNTLLFLYKNIFYKNVEAEICEILRIF